MSRIGFKSKKTKEEVEEAAKNSFSKAGMCRYFGWNPTGSYKVIDRYIKIYNIDISHFTNKPLYRKSPINKLNSEEYGKGYYCKSATLLRKLFEEGKKERRCECCGNTMWNEKTIPLELHHIDGNHFNNDFNNLMVLCPNCHAQTDNYKGKKNKENEEYFCKKCGKKITKYTKTGLCLKCMHDLQKKCYWSKDELIQLHSKYSNVKIGKMYGVSDNTVKKWLKYYGIIK